MASAILPVCERMGAGFCAQAEQFAVLGMPAVNAAAMPVKVAPPKKKRR